MYDPVQYFDEMNILKDDKLRRIKTAKEFINTLVDFFTAQFMNLLSGIFLYEKHDRRHYERRGCSKAC